MSAAIDGDLSVAMFADYVSVNAGGSDLGDLGDAFAESDGIQIGSGAKDAVGWQAADVLE